MNDIFQTVPVDSAFRGFDLRMHPLGLSTLATVAVEPMHLTNGFTQDTSSDYLFVVAEFPENEEPRIHGLGMTREKALWFARYLNAPGLENAVVCERMSTPDPRWRAPGGQVVLLEHCAPKRKARK